MDTLEGLRCVTCGGFWHGASVGHEYRTPAAVDAAERLARYAEADAEARRAALAAAPFHAGDRVTRKGTTRPVGTVVNAYLDKRRRPRAYVRWDRSQMGGSRIGGGTETHSAVLMSGLRAAGEAN